MNVRHSISDMGGFRPEGDSQIAMEQTEELVGGGSQELFRRRLHPGEQWCVWFTFASK